MIIINWKKYKEKYYISNTGLIKNINTNKILKLRKNCRGYLKTNISINGKLKTVFIHRLVAITFIPNPNNYPQVNHKDGNKENNNVENLEWCSPKQNIEHAIKLGLIYHLKGVECNQSRLRRKDILYLRKLYKPSKKFKHGLLTKLAKQFNVSRHTIKNAINYNTYKNI